MWLSHTTVAGNPTRPAFTSKAEESLQPQGWPGMSIAGTRKQVLGMLSAHLDDRSPLGSVSRVVRLIERWTASFASRDVS